MERIKLEAKLRSMGYLDDEIDDILNAYFKTNPSDALVEIGKIAVGVAVGSAVYDFFTVE
jgi:hypothetical protein